MEQRKDDILRRPLYVYDLPKDILDTLVPKDDKDDETTTIDTQEVGDPTQKRRNISVDAVTGSKACSLCGVNFPTVEEQKSHVRSDLHNYNLKQKIRGRNPVAEAEFEKLVGDLDESLSGSDSSESEEEENEDARKETTLTMLLRKQAAISAFNEGDEDLPAKRNQGSGKAPLFWFTTPLLPSNLNLGIYRAIFNNTEQANQPGILETLQKKQLRPKPQKKVASNSNNGVPPPDAYDGPHIFMCMIGGGHFAAMVVSLSPKQTKSASSGPMTREATVLAHKTFHRYTTRRKQGGAQSANDAAKGAAHSAGSSLRRYNEQALTEEVRALLQDWKGMIDTSELLFVRATGNTNRRTLFGPYDGQVLRQNDPRIRGFPFSTRRATQNELMRSFIELTRVKVYEVDEVAIQAAKLAAEKQSTSTSTTKASKQTQPTPALTEAESTALHHTTQIQTLIRRSKLPTLLTYLKTHSLPPHFPFYPQSTPQNHHAPTPLHLAASSNSPTLITGLLLKAHADPMLLNADGKTAFELCGDRASRDAFRVARGEIGEEAWDWEMARVPPALSRAEAEARDAKEKVEEEKLESERRRVEEERLAREGPKVDVASTQLGRAAEKGRAVALGRGRVVGTAEERRVEEGRGLSPEMRARLERERRARAAEERMRRVGG